MSDQDEQKYGLEGIEASQNYVPMASPDGSHPSKSDESPIEDSPAYRHLDRQEIPEPLVREYTSADGSNERRPDNEVVTAERASADLAAIREEERLEADRARNAALNQELDDATATLDAIKAAEAPHVQQEEWPDVTPQPDPEHALAVDPQIDGEVAAALQNPKIRGLLEATSQQFEQAKSQYQEQVAHAGMTAVASFVSAFPELANLNADQLPGAIALINQTNPARAQEIATHYNRVNGLVQQMQQVSAQTAQQRNEMALASFKQFAVVSDHRFDSLNAHVPAETMKAIKTEAVAMLKEYGLSEADLAREYNSNPLFRSAAGQQIISDAARFRLSQKGLSQRRANPVPQVQRPGIAEPSARNDDGAVSAALARLNAPGGAEGRQGLRNAAAVVAARRGNRR